eukprot:TRINITY_DN4476_c0_g1_i1.p1 TRINITY_DN4476_c0_g1~~TRINITY_DN4476_c0_g1_i1.p1  ORF type:complete len:336 (+),score=98.59 TRINITY_DN4476_c0_g1_i1:59-1066(+)
MSSQPSPVYGIPVQGQQMAYQPQQQQQQQGFYQHQGAHPHGQPGPYQQMPPQRRGLDGGFDGEGGPKWSVKVGSCCFEIPVYLSYYLPILWVFTLIQTVRAYAGTDDLGPMVARDAFVVVLILPLTVLLHEMGHCMGAKSVNTSVKQILLWPLGGLAFIGCTPSRCADIWVAFAGPLTHAPMFLGWWGLAAAAEPDCTKVMVDQYGTRFCGAEHVDEWHGFWYMTFERCMWLQVILAAFNLLVPAYPLDGGRILANCLTYCLAPVTAAYVTMGVCALCCIGLFVASILYYGFSLGAVLNVLFISAFIGYSNWKLYECVKSGAIDSHPLFHRGQQD